MPKLSNPKSLILDQISSESVVKIHPWIFGKRIENKLKDFQAGDIINLYDSNSRLLGTGIYSGEDELIAIRVFHFGEGFSLKKIYENLSISIQKRLPLLIYTDSFRLIHGENDNFPGITVDYHAGTLLLRYYSKSLYTFSRMIINAIWILVWNNPDWNLRIENAYIQIPNRTGKKIPKKDNRLIVLRGIKKEYINIRYRNITYKIKPNSQKGGIYNDIRNLRDYLWLHKNYVHEKTVLNLFSNNGLLSNCLVNLGAKRVYSIEDSRECIEIHKLNTPLDSKQEIIKLDIFKEYESYTERINKKFGLIIIDPPSLTSNSKDKHNAIKIYKKLTYLSIKILEESGILVVCSCSNRIHSNEFESIVKEVFNESSIKMKRLDKLKNEIDHPVLDTFPEGNYFKVHIYKKI